MQRLGRLRTEPSLAGPSETTSDAHLSPVGLLEGGTGFGDTAVLYRYE